MQTKTKRNISAASVAKWLVGIFLIGGCIYLAFTQGELLLSIRLSDILTATTISVATIVVNAAITGRAVRLLGGKINNAEAIRITSVGTFSNTLIGLPIGTAYKFVVLRRSSNLSSRHILFGLLYFTLMNVLILTAVAGVSSKNYWLCTPLALTIALPLLPVKLLPSFTKNLFRWQTHLINVLFCFVACALMISCYMALSTIICADSSCFSDQITVVSLGMAFNFLINGQSIGGVPELTMGFSSLLHGYGMLLGIELGIALRFCSLAAAILIITTQYTLERKNW